MSEHEKNRAKITENTLDETKQKPKFLIDTTFDYDGYPDFWLGHGHAFADNNLICCQVFAISINYQETVKDIIDMILEDSRAHELNPINEELFTQYKEEIYDIMTNQNIKESIRNELKSEVKDSDRFFYEDLERDENIKEAKKDNFAELPFLIGWIHVYLENDK